MKKIMTQIMQKLSIHTQNTTDCIIIKSCDDTRKKKKKTFTRQQH